MYLEMVIKMMPYFFAVNHIHGGRLYYLSWKTVKKIIGCITEPQCLHVWNGIWSDMFIKTTFMRYGHEPQALKTWALGLHICSKVNEGIENLINEDNSPKVQNKEEMTSNIKKDEEDRTSIRQKLSKSMDIAQNDKNLVNIVNGKCK